MIALLDHPAELERLRAEPELVPNAVEETLRFDPPVQGLPRMTAADVEVGDEKIPAGARVMLMIGAANRDPERWPEPDRFDVARDTTGHLGFGFGIHFCLGSHLARLESRIGLEAIVDPAREPAPRGRDRAQRESDPARAGEAAAGVRARPLVGEHRRRRRRVPGERRGLHRGGALRRRGHAGGQPAACSCPIARP